METVERDETGQPAILPSLPLKAGLSPADVHVLLVDDEQLSRTIVSNLLRRCDYAVTTAENGAQAMELLRSSAPGTFQLVLTDVCMPEVDGIQLLHYVKGEDALRSVPVIMMSSIEQGETVYECVQGGAEEYLVKPVTRKEIQHMWQHVLRKRSAAATVPQAPLAAAEAAQAEGSPAGEQRKMQRNQYHSSGNSLEPLALSSAAAGGVVPGSQACITSTTHAAAPIEDFEATRHFLRLMRNARQEEVATVEKQIGALQADANAVAKRLLSEGDGDDCDGEASASNTATECPASSKRRRTSENKEMAPKDWNSVTGERLHDLEGVYFQRRGAKESSNHLDAFARDLNVLARGNTVSVEASLRAGDIASPQEMVCCADFDADDRFFATVSVSRSVKVFDFEAVLEAPTTLHFPAWQATTRSKLSSVSWNSYIRSHLITSDYDGLIQLWDASAGPGTEAAQFDEHSRRVWSLDFSRLDPMRFVSGSDDATIRLWNINQNASVTRMHAPANVCSVQFSPTNGNILAAGCANHRVYLYDLRRPDAPAAVIAGPSRAVSYVRFIGGEAVAAASTDSAVRIWGVEEALTAGSSALAPRCMLGGHKNERNFVGLSASADGLIATGSEDNALHVYCQTLPFSIASHSLSSEDGQSSDGNTKAAPATSGSRRSHRTFVSSVCWTRAGRRCLVANSEGLLRVLRVD